jgi:hypothetical protein
MGIFGTLMLFGICYVIADTWKDARDAKLRKEHEAYEEARLARRRSYRAPGNV